MRRATALFSAGVLAAAPVAHAGDLSPFLQEQRVSGVLRTDYYRSSRNLDDATDFLGATAQLKALPSLAENIDGKLELRIANPAIGRGTETGSRLLEAYATVHFEKADVRIGKQIVAWGRADGINPTDNLTPRDLTVALPFEEDQRFGAVAVKLDAFLSEEHTLSVFASPYFVPTKIPRPAAARPPVETTPARNFSNTEIGLKLDKVGEGFDWSLSAFRGFSLLPDARQIGGGPRQPVLELHYDRIVVLGADFARNFGRFGFRGEVAYVDTADDAGTNPSVKNPYLSWIVGIDRTFLDNLNVNLQFFQRRVRRHQNPAAIANPLERGIAVQNAIADGQRDRIGNGISLRVGDKWFNDTLETEIFAVVNFTRHDRFIRPLLTYAFSDRWKGTIGAEIYLGAADTQFGGLKPNRGAFAELRYGF